MTDAPQVVLEAWCKHPAWEADPYGWPHCVACRKDPRQIEREAQLEEREACAQAVEEVGRRWLGRGAAAFEEVASAIRSRK